MPISASSPGAAPIPRNHSFNFALVGSVEGFPTQSIGRLLVVSGIILIVIGVIFLFGDKIPWLGKLPGDITIKRENFTLHIPIVTMLILSILLTVILNLFSRR